MYRFFWGSLYIFTEIQFFPFNDSDEKWAVRCCVLTDIEVENFRRIEESFLIHIVR